MPSMSLAAVAAGTDGIMIEVHNNPEKAWSDGNQSINPEIFTGLCRKMRFMHDELMK